MRIPIHAIFARGTKPGEEPRLISADYAEIPDNLLMGTMAQAAIDVATVRGDMESAHTLSDALGRAQADGKIQTL